MKHGSRPAFARSLPHRSGAVDNGRIATVAAGIGPGEQVRLGVGAVAMDEVNGPGAVVAQDLRVDPPAVTTGDRRILAVQTGPLLPAMSGRKCHPTERVGRPRPAMGGSVDHAGVAQMGDDRKRSRSKDPVRAPEIVRTLWKSH